MRKSSYKSFIWRFLILLALAGGASFAAWAQGADTSPPDRPGSIAAMARALSPELAATRDPLAIAEILRDQVYRNVPVAPTPADVDWLDLQGMYDASVVRREYGHECGGRVLLYLAALREFGIRARYVGLFTAIENVDPATTFVHASTEVFIGGRWIAMDAHYNISLRDDRGRRIGWLEAQRLLANGRAVTMDRDGRETRPEVSIEHFLAQYRSDLRQLTRYVVIGISSRYGRAVPAAADGTWDGMLGYVDGTTYDALKMAEREEYRLLATPPARNK